MKSLAGKVAVVTGGGDGIGKAYCIYLASKGVKVVVNNRIPPNSEERKADKVVEEIRKNKGEASANYD